MPRRKSLDPMIQCKVCFRPDLYARARLLIHNDSYTHGFPKGAFSDLINKALEAYLQPLIKDKP